MTQILETNLSGAHEIVADLGIVRLRNGDHVSSFTVTEAAELIEKVEAARKEAQHKFDHRGLGQFK